MMNIGNGYSTETGKFTAPVDGLNFFSVNLCTPNNKYLNYAITKVEKDLLMSTHYTDKLSCGSGSVFVTLRTGETVWVKSTYSNVNQLTENTHGRNTFTGALIQLRKSSDYSL